MHFFQQEMSKWKGALVFFDSDSCDKNRYYHTNWIEHESLRSLKLYLNDFQSGFLRFSHSFFAHAINPKGLVVFYIFQGQIHIFKEYFTKVQDNSRTKGPFLQIPGVFQDQGQIQLCEPWNIRPSVKINRKIFFLFLNQNICCGYSKEQSQWDCSFKHPKHMLKIMAKKKVTILSWKFYANLQNKQRFRILTFCPAESKYILFKKQWKSISAGFCTAFHLPHREPDKLCISVNCAFKCSQFAKT